MDQGLQASQAPASQRIRVESGASLATHPCTGASLEMHGPANACVLEPQATVLYHCGIRASAHLDHLSAPPRQAASCTAQENSVDNIGKETFGHQETGGDEDTSRRS